MVKKMKILGVMTDYQLNFLKHVSQICNKLRRYANYLWRLKKHGLGVNHAVQYVMCLRGHVTFGLWWAGGLSDRSWSRLETVWNNLIKGALHEKCPKKLSVEKAHEFTGLTGVKVFFEYLIHLRTVKIENPAWTKCERFTLSFAELTAMRNLELVHERVRPNARARTKALTVSSMLERKREKMIDKLGSVKYFIFLCAEKYKWTEQDFTLEKLDLRNKYDISKKKYLTLF